MRLGASPQLGLEGFGARGKLATTPSGFFVAGCADGIASTNGMPEL